MSDNKKPLDDKTRQFNLNDVDDKTRVFSLSDDEISGTREFSVPESAKADLGLSDNDEKDFFTDQPLEDIADFSKKIEKPVTSYDDGFEETVSPEDISNGPSVENRAVTTKTDNRKSGHSAPKKKKTPVVVLTVASALVVIAIIVTVLICVKGCSSNNNVPVDESTTITTTAEETTEYTEEVTEETTVEETTVEETTEEVTTQEETTTVEETTESETEETTNPEGQYYNATFGAYKCVTPDGEVISDDIGTELGGYTAISLAEDGTYNLAVGTIANASGNYAIDGNYISMDGYSGNINFDNAGNPVGIVASVDGYTVYFN